MGKTFSRVSNVALQGVSLGGTGGKDEKPPEIELTNLSNSIPAQTSNLSIQLDKTSAVKPSVGFRSLAIGNNAIGFACRVVEQFILLNYYHDECRHAENVGVVFHYFALLPCSLKGNISNWKS